MAPNNPFASLLPTAQQPTAQQVPLGQAGQVVPAGQVPGAGSLPSASGIVLPGQASPAGGLLSTASPGQPTTPGLISQIPAAAPYLALTPYLAANEAAPQPQLPQYDDATLQAISTKLLAQSQHPVLSGKASPLPTSQLAKMQAPMSPGQILQTAGIDFWNQEITQPIKDYINTWRTNPEQGLLETLGGVAVTAGIVGLEALTGGAATPFIFAAFAALQAPSLISAWADEVTHPSDANMVKAIVSTGSAAIAVGSPVKAFKSMALARNLFEGSMQARQDIYTADQAADLLLGTRNDVRAGIRVGAPIRKQLETLDINNVDHLQTQLQRRGVNLADEGDPAAQLLKHAQAVQAMRDRLLEAKEAGDDAEAGHALADMKQYVRDNLKDSMLQTSYDYVFLPNTPYTHTYQAIPDIEPELKDTLDSGFRRIRGLLRETSSGNALQGLHEAATSNIASIKEAEALDRAAGGAHDMASRILGIWQASKKAAGVKNDSEMESILQGLEEPDKWDKLAPAHQALGAMLRDISNTMSLGELKQGTISQVLEGRVAHYFQGVGDKAALAVDPPAQMSQWLRSPLGSRSRFWKIAIDGETGEVQFQSKTRSKIIEDLQGQTELYESTHAHRQTYATHGRAIDTARRSIAALKKGDVEARRAEAIATAKANMGPLAADLIKMKRKELNKILAAKPQDKELITGDAAVQQMIARHVHRMHRATIGNALWTHANMNVNSLMQELGKLKMSHWGAAMTSPEFKNKHEMPDILPATVFEGSMPRSTEDNAKQLGYFLAHPPTGSKGDLNYRPALYARGELANQIQRAAEEATAAQHQTGLLNALYKTNNVSKRFIMYSPLFHGMNVAGRAIGWVLSDPALAGSAMKILRGLQQDGEGYYALLEEAASNGMVHADKWNVSDHVNRLLKDDDGQSRWPGAIRAPLQALANVHHDVLEAGLWRGVDQLQLAGYLYSKSRFLDKGIDEVQAGRLAAQYANNLGGMVNPLYMSRLWKQLKGLLWFAPSYWSTFLHSVQSVVPGQSRLSTALLQSGKGRAFTGLAAVPLRAIDNRARIELTRAQRDWVTTYLAATAVSMDMLNVMASGHHLWENEQGHEWDIDVTNVPGVGGTTLSPSGEVKRAFITTHPLFRQGSDLGAAIGLGQDWGFAHTFGDVTFQQANAFQKGTMMMGALLDGIRRQGATKIGNIPQAAYGAVTGEELTSRVGESTQVQIDRPSALLSLFPSGYQIQRFLKTYQQATGLYPVGTPQAKQAQQQLQQAVQGALPSALINMTGLPTVYHMGVERPPIDDSKYENWVTQRNSIHAQLLQYSNAVFAGEMQPIEYSRHKQELVIRENQLNTDTWGSSSPGATLSSAYTTLAQQFGLDDTGLSDQDWFERYDAFLPAWNQLLAGAPPDTRAAYWEHETAQWTDADYLEWEARSLRDALAASIDGQGGNYIRAFQNQLFRLQPTMTVADYTAYENSDPYYSAYRTLLTEMGSTSPLGAFVSAFSSPFTQTVVLPPGFTQAQAQDVAQHTGKTVVRAEEAQQLASQAKQIAGSPQVQQAGGIAAASPEFVQQEQQAVAAANQG